jgi:hypothetical protein
MPGKDSKHLPPARGQAPSGQTKALSRGGPLAPDLVA